MPSLALRHILPSGIGASLWGNRKRWGLTIDPEDPCWLQWQRTYGEFYNANQREGIGKKVNDAGYRVMQQIDLTGKKVLEVGAGDIRHSSFWRGTPAEYILADIYPEMMQKAEISLKEKNVPYRAILMQREESLPLADASIDIIVSFYSLEHIYPLQPYLAEMRRILKPGGTLIGAIPTEGGLAWGAGRFITSRRWLKNNTGIDPDKIICWEHPNFADEIINALDLHFCRDTLAFWPLLLPLIDCNLIIRFVYKNAPGNGH